MSILFSVNRLRNMVDPTKLHPPSGRLSIQISTLRPKARLLNQPKKLPHSQTFSVLHQWLQTVMQLPVLLTILIEPEPNHQRRGNDMRVRRLKNGQRGSKRRRKRETKRRRSGQRNLQRQRPKRSRTMIASDSHGGWLIILSRAAPQKGLCIIRSSHWRLRHFDIRKSLPSIPE